MFVHNTVLTWVVLCVIRTDMFLKRFIYKQYKTCLALINFSRKRMQYTNEGGNQNVLLTKQTSILITSGNKLFWIVMVN